MAIWRMCVCVCVCVLYMVFVRTGEERREAVCVFKGLKSPSCSKSPLSTWPRPPHYHHQHHQYHHQRQHQQNVAYSDNLHVHKVDRRWKHSSHRSIKRVFRGADWIQGWNWSRTLAQIAGTSLGSRYWPQLVFLSALVQAHWWLWPCFEYICMVTMICWINSCRCWQRMVGPRSYRVVFFNWSARFSVPKWKTSCSQPGLVFHEIFNVKNFLVGWASVFILTLKIGRTS